MTSDSSGSRIELDGATYAPRRIFCIGRNYADHAAELGNRVPESPVIFMKPVSCLVPAGRTIRRPTHGSDLHFEAELVLLIGGDPGSEQTPASGAATIVGVALGLDLTLRDLQSSFKDRGLPWELAKAFDGSAPIGDFMAASAVDLASLEFTCSVNGSVRQRGNTADMIFPPSALMAAISRAWTLLPGDLIYTGTPAGVGGLDAGDRVVVEAEEIGSFAWNIG